MEFQNAPRGPEYRTALESLRALLNERAHLSVLCYVTSYDLVQPDFSPEAKPPFAMSLDEINDRLSDWIVDLLTVDCLDVDASECHAMLLGWCAQLIVGQAPHSSTKPFTQESVPLAHDSVDMVDVGRSVYSYAIGSISGSHLPTRVDSTLITALVSFSFLEGVARRRLSAYITETGRVHTPFPSGPKSGRLNDIGKTLGLLEEHVDSQTLRERLQLINSAAAARGLSESSRRLFEKPGTSVYEVIRAHRNSNLHGGEFVGKVGLAALALATVIALDTISASFDELQRIARGAVAGQAPLDPNGHWPHYIFYPAPTQQVWVSTDPHHWVRMIEAGGNSYSSPELGPISRARYECAT